MKRYRVLNLHFDTRAIILSQRIEDSWEVPVKESWKTNQQLIVNELIHEFGIDNSQSKIGNYLDLGAAPWSVLAHHNKFIRQIRNAFVIGSYYAALTSACSLGERILNRIILVVRNDYTSTPQYKQVYRKQSFDNWDLVINTLSEWGVLLPEVAANFHQLKDMRNKSIHFNPETDTDDRDLALNAIRKLSEIIEGQFSASGGQPWFIKDTPGSTYVSKESENVPFVKHFILPSCHLVGAQHKLESSVNGWIVLDDHPYPTREITDAEFVASLKGDTQS